MVTETVKTGMSYKIQSSIMGKISPMTELGLESLTSATEGLVDKVYLERSLC